MGIIKRQAVKQSIVNYLGVGIGAISVLWIYPQATEVYGLARFLIDTATFVAPFLLLGVGAVTIKFFPELHTPDHRNQGMLSFLLTVPLFSSLLFVVLAFIFRPWMAEFASDKEEAFGVFWLYIVPIAVALAFFQLFYNYSTNYGRIAIPAVFQNFIKLVLPVVILLWVAQLIDLHTLVWSIVLNYLLALLAIVLYLRWLGVLRWQRRWDLLTPDRRKRILHYAMFGLFGGIGSVLAFRIDSIMISTLIDFKGNGVFTIAAFIGNAIAVPTNAVNQISAPVLTRAIKENRIDEVEQIYKDAAVNLLLVGLLLFGLVACSLSDLFRLMPAQGDFAQDPGLVAQGMSIVLLVGVARLVDMGTSVNNPIINFSPFYRFGLYAILILGVLNIFTNLFFIRTLEMGIVGVAMATLVALCLYNGFKLLFIYRKFGIHPFSRTILRLLLLAALAFAPAFFFPATGLILLDIAVRSLIMVLIYVILAYRFRISPEVNDFLDRRFGR